MTDLHRRFAKLDTIPARLDWEDVERRVVIAAATRVSAGRPTLRHRGSARRASTALSPRLVLVVVAAITAALAIGAVLVGSAPPATNETLGPTFLASPLASPAPTEGGVVEAPCPELPAPTTLRLTEVPGAIAFSPPVQVGCTVWTAAETTGNPAGLYELDLRTGVLTRHHADLDVESAQIDGEDLWILARARDLPQDGALLRISTDDGAILQVIPLTSERTGHWLRILDGRAWLGGMRNSDAVHVIELATGRDLGTAHVPGAHTSPGPITFDYLAPVALTPDAAWTVTPFGLIRIDAQTLNAAAIPGAAGASQVAVAAGFPWRRTDRHFFQHDPDSGEVRTSLPFDTVADYDLFMASDGTFLWAIVQPRGVDSTAAAELVEIDGETGEVLRRIPYENRDAAAFYATPGRLWVSVPGQPAVRIDLPLRP